MRSRLESHSVLWKDKASNPQNFLLMSLQDISQTCRISLEEAKTLFDHACYRMNRPLQCFEQASLECETFTTGDTVIDHAIGGGIRTGMIWEVAGESASGKSQLALQLSLLVQLPPSLGGLSGATCYLNVGARLPTNRLHQLMNTHPLISPSLCDLSNVHTIFAPDPDRLLHILSYTLPEFIVKTSNDKALKPVRLVVIDALPDAFRSTPSTTMATLVDRSRYISKLSTCLLQLASQHDIAMLVLNEVTDTFNYDRILDRPSRELLYHDQTRWFAQPGVKSVGNGREASLGLVWANQVNVRIFLTRTAERIVVETHQAMGIDTAHQNQTALIRKMFILFSPVSLPTSLDYIVTSMGVSCINKV